MQQGNAASIHKSIGEEEMNVLEMQNIYKSFSGVSVLRGVSLTVKKGEVHALLGENGAGKSTLMNILTGSVSLDSGSVEFAGKHIENISIKESEAYGIAFVHQELNLFNDLKVFENIFFGKEYINKFHKLDKKAMIKKAEELFESLGVDINPNEVVSNLSTSEKQLLEIAKALFFEAKLLILDEPTTALNNEEIAHLFSILNKLKKEGKSFIFISHKMPEIFEISDSYTVFRNGEFIQTGHISDITPEGVTKLMVGEKYSLQEIYKKRTLGDTVLELENYSGDGFKNINMKVQKGEIIGFTGLQGAGSSELMQSIFGINPEQKGVMKVYGKQIKSGDIHKAMKDKIAMLPANRKENSVISDMNILENMYISEHTLSSKKQIISKRKEVEKYDKQKILLNIKAKSHDYNILSLSGGNQQKVFLARWLNTEAEILLLDNPTQGIDVGAKAEIYKLILKLAESGKTIIMNTLEIQEIQKVADKCAVFYNGEIVKTLEHDEISEETVMLYSTNAIGTSEDR